MARTKVKLWFPVLLPEPRPYFVQFSSYLLQTSTKYIRKVPWIRIWIPSKTCYRLRRGKWRKEVKSLLPGYALLSFEEGVKTDWSMIEEYLQVTFVRSPSGYIEPMDMWVVENLENEEKIELWDVANFPTKIGVQVRVKVDAKNYPCAGRVCVFMGIKEIDGGYFARVLYDVREFDIPLDFLERQENE